MTADPSFAATVCSRPGRVRPRPETAAIFGLTMSSQIRLTKVYKASQGRLLGGVTTSMVHCGAVRVELLASCRSWEMCFIIAREEMYPSTLSKQYNDRVSEQDI